MQEKMPVPLSGFVELGKKARVQKEKWFMKSAIALSVNDDPELLLSLAKKLRFKALVEDLDPFPFYIPSMEEFLDGESFK